MYVYFNEGYVCMYKCMYKCMYECMYVCMYECTWQQLLQGGVVQGQGGVGVHLQQEELVGRREHEVAAQQIEVAVFPQQLPAARLLTQRQYPAEDDT